jgi:hypothetical protein
MPTPSDRDEEAARVWAELNVAERRCLLWSLQHGKRRLPSELNAARRRLWERNLFRFDDSARVRTDLGNAVATHGLDEYAAKRHGRTQERTP